MMFTILHSNLALIPYADLLTTIFTSFPEEYRKHQAVDHFQENLKYMMNSQFTVDDTITQKVRL